MDKAALVSGIAKSAIARQQAVFPPQVLQTTLEGCCEKFDEPKQTVLFRRGEPAFGMFLVLKGKVTFDFGVDGSNLPHTTYGPGVLVGLRATLTAHKYSMTAIVTEDAEVGFISMKALQDLLRSRSVFYQQLLILSGSDEQDSARSSHAEKAVI